MSHLKKYGLGAVLPFLVLIFWALPAAALETNVTAKVQLIKSRLMYDLPSNTSYLDVSVKNISADVLDTPIKVVIGNITRAEVTVQNADGVTTPGGEPYIEYAGSSGQLLPGESTETRRIMFDNPQRLRFTYTMTVFSVQRGDIPLTGKVPDTGQTTSYTDIFGEDSDYTINPQSYTKLDADGNCLPDSATSWAMIRDNVTGLIWENKQNKDGVKNYSNPNDADNTYTWYDPNPATNGGNAGTPGNGTDTQDFINALNAANFGGHHDWRLPTVKELSWGVNLDHYNPAINTAYFQNTFNFLYWSSTTFAYNAGRAWVVSFYGGDVGYGGKSDSYYVRAVRGGE